MKIVISLVGGQLDPNLLTPLQLEATRSVLFRTPDTNREAKNLIDALGVNGISASVQETPAFDFAQTREDIRKKVETLRDEHQGSEIWINYTGGTKIMSLAAFEVARELDLRTAYLEPRSSSLLTTLGTLPQPSIPISVKFTIEAFFALKGFSVQRNKSLETNAQTRKAFTEFVYENIRNSAIFHNKLFSKVFQFRIKNSTANNYEKLIGTFITENFWNSMVSKNMSGFQVKLNSQSANFNTGAQLIEYFSGGWLEEYVFNKFYDSRCADDVTIGLRFLSSENDVMNECDVVAINKGQSTFVECKSGNFNSTDIDKFHSVAKMYGGDYAKGVWLSYYPIPISGKSSKMRKFSMNKINLIEGMKQIKNSLNNPCQLGDIQR
ncbi:MAG: DUF1887 family CARF protein [Chloroherpetonaceae bacterium]|nr:DUF1887 family CARF protein [Chloroherpetonaceae bacterium]